MYNIEYMNNNTIIRLIDNTKTGDISDNVYVAGYSHLTRQLWPNYGEVIFSTRYKKQDIVYFFNYGMVEVCRDNNLFVIPDQNIFLCNDEIIGNGLVVRKESLTQGQFFKLREQEWFYVVKSTCEIPRQTIIICKPRSAYRFNYGNVQSYYLTADQVMFYLDGEVLPGPANIFLDEIPAQPFEKQHRLRGKIGQETVFFRKRLSSIKINGKNKIIVKKDDVYATQF